MAAGYGCRRGDGAGSARFASGAGAGDGGEDAVAGAGRVGVEGERVEGGFGLLEPVLAATAFGGVVGGVWPAASSARVIELMATSIGRRFAGMASRSMTTEVSSRPRAGRSLSGTRCDGLRGYVVEVDAETVVVDRRNGPEQLDGSLGADEAMPSQADSPAAKSPFAPKGAESLGLKIGDDVRHSQWGEGVIVDMGGSHDNPEATVNFATVGQKALLLSLAPWRSSSRGWIFALS